ncbi:helix-turn-helix domain-containing protein [Rhizobium halophytocola]|uniref:AraC-like DNA-binding protein n=1 Tax=Rhizobium halophytocola TaxID=735519 RepID=A0ABS4DVD9_9HYPH|nr:AraC family transcriptional regulator [Rhizobium halophytocola]MBP1849635.1 AraC-like DNA-binding protein [Rhizobium halophytocola]
MNYQHSMIGRTQGITPVRPPTWRGFDGVMSVYWHATGQSGASAYYLSPDPRIVIFFNDVSQHIRIANRESGFGRQERPMTRATYVPAGMPLWTRFSGDHRFSHLDLHVHQNRLLRMLAPSLGPSAARAVLRRPVEIQDIGAIETLAGLLVEELSHPARHAIYAESLVAAIASALLDIPAEDDTAIGQLTQLQMEALLARFDAGGGERMTVAEMATTVGLSESWFTTVFKQTTGRTPLQWQLARRIDAAQRLLVDSELSLADIAAQLGFSDQAHLTKAFRHVAGETPAAWRRMKLGP